MAYYLGRDVKVWILSEDPNQGVKVTSNAAKLEGNENATNFAQPRTTDAAADTYALTDLTGVDGGIGVTDEDVSYIGLRTVLKAEIKKETTITITRKKSNNHLELLFQQGRYGMTSAGAGIQSHTALIQPASTHFGYRVHLAFDDGVDVMSIPHCQISSYSATMSADGVQEETIELMSHVTPVVGINEQKSTVSGF